MSYPVSIEPNSIPESNRGGNGIRRYLTFPAGEAGYLPVYAFGAFTVVYHLAFLSEWSFTTLMAITLCLALGFVLSGSPALWRIGKDSLFARGTAPGPYIGLGLLCVTMGGLALFANKPDTDDAHYLANAVYFFENPLVSIRRAYPFATLPQDLPVRFDQITSYEALQAIIASWLGLHPLDSYHFLMPILAGGAIPLAWFAVLRQQTSCRWAAVAGVSAICILSLLDGWLHRSVGNWGLFRIWQGKVILCAVLIPLAIRAAIDCLSQGDKRGPLMRTVALSIAGIGLSPTAVFLLPIAYGFCAFSYALAMQRRLPLKLLALMALLISVYPVAAVLPFLFHLSGNAVEEILIYANGLGEVLLTVYAGPAGPVLWASLCGLMLLGLRGQWRSVTWCLLWALMIALPLAWPPSARLIVDYVTTSDALWRLAYASPVILIIGLAITKLFEEANRRRLALIILASGLSIALVTGFRGDRPSPFAHPDLTFPALSYRVPAGERRLIETLNSSLDPGTLLAPLQISQWMPLFSAKLRLVTFRNFEAPPYLRLLGRPEEAEDVKNALHLVGNWAPWIEAMPPQAPVTEAMLLESFRRLLAHRIDYVLLVTEIAERPDVVRILAEAGYRAAVSYDQSYSLFVAAKPPDDMTSP